MTFNFRTPDATDETDGCLLLAVDDAVGPGGADVDDVEEPDLDGRDGKASPELLRDLEFFERLLAQVEETPKEDDAAAGAFFCLLFHSLNACVRNLAFAG